METYTPIQFSKKMGEYWDTTEYLPPTNGHQFQFFTKGKIIEEQFLDVDGSHMLSLVIIKDAEYTLTNGQLCAIMDEGNHCVSRGSCLQEDNYLYITWSNLGHT